MPPSAIVLIRSQGTRAGSNLRPADKSERRISAVRNSLLRAGVDPQRIIAQGNDGPNPIASGAGAHGAQPDGGVELVILDLAQLPEFPPSGRQAQTSGISSTPRQRAAQPGFEPRSSPGVDRRDGNSVPHVALPVR